MFVLVCCDLVSCCFEKCSQELGQYKESCRKLSEESCDLVSYVITELNNLFQQQKRRAALKTTNRPISD